jgi:hypothetical protein
MPGGCMAAARGAEGGRAATSRMGTAWCMATMQILFALHWLSLSLCDWPSGRPHPHAVHSA